MNITNADLNFLIELQHYLKEAGSYEIADELWYLIDKLSKQRIKTNEYVRNRVSEKRKVDKNYARKKVNNDNL